MTPYDFVHLVIHAAGGTVEGRTKLQKLVYFAGALTGHLDRLGYRPHYYGPYSADVAGAVQELRGLNFLTQAVYSIGSESKSGFEVTRYDYTLTDEGKEVATEKALANSDLSEKISKAVKSTNDQDYVRLAIAAKTHLITEREGRQLSESELRQKAAQHGWSFSSDQFNEAWRFLGHVGLNRSSK